MPELWFVFDQEQNAFSTFLTEPEAKTAYEKLIKEVRADAGANGEFESDGKVFLGRVHAQAELVPVGINEDNGHEIWDMVSYGMVD